MRRIRRHCILNYITTTFTTPVNLFISKIEDSRKMMREGMKMTYLCLFALYCKFVQYTWKNVEHYYYDRIKKCWMIIYFPAFVQWAVYSVTFMLTEKQRNILHLMTIHLSLTITRNGFLTLRKIIFHEPISTVFFKFGV